MSVTAGLGLALALIVLQRAVELGLSARHLRGLRARGATEFGRGHFPAIVALHVAMPLGLAAEVLVGGARPWAGWPLFLLPLAVASALRVAAMRTLGTRWHVRVWVVPGESPNRTGIYRWIRHPNYVAVAIEMACLPLLFGAWRTAIVASLVNAVLLAIRIRVEERALRWASGQPEGAATAPAAVTPARSA